MTLNPSGPMKMGGDFPGQSIAQELGKNLYASISLNDADVRSLLQRPSGSISMADAWGKSNIKEISFTFTTSVPNCTLDVHDIGGYVAGVTDVKIYVNPGVYLYATANDIYGLRIQGAIAGDTVTLTNYGYIIGRGGDGPTIGGDHVNDGGHALSLGCPITINNQSYIAGGGGGGTFTGGGGGAGGGDGGNGCVGTQGYGGGLGQTGTNAMWPGPCGVASYGGGAGGGGSCGYFNPIPCCPGGGLIVNMTGGGGGGRILPGVGGNAGRYNSPGGSGNSPSPGIAFCPYCDIYNYRGTGGGGWGASGGSRMECATYGIYIYGGNGGPSIITYGNPISWVNYGNLWGSVV